MLCTICKQEDVGPKAASSGLTYCRTCFYTGRALANERAKTVSKWASFMEPFGAEWADVWHTGGGCFSLGAELPDGREILFGGEGDVPAESVEEWGFSVTFDPAEGSGFGTGALGTFEVALDVLARYLRGEPVGVETYPF